MNAASYRQVSSYCQIKKKNKWQRETENKKRKVNEIFYVISHSWGAIIMAMMPEQKKQQKKQTK